MIAISYQNICMSYGNETIIEDFNLSVNAGRFLVIIGTSGSGKTTLLKMANGLILPTKGRVLVKGQSTSETDLISLRRGIGYAIQGSVLFPHMTVEQNIAYVPGLLKGHTCKKTNAAVRKWMEIAGLDEDLRKRYPHQLSGGQQQRVGIARAMAASPDILLMDEPFSAVDQITRSALQEEIKQIHKTTGITILFVTHDFGEAFKLGDEILVMDKGKALQCDSPEMIKINPANEFVKTLVSRNDMC